MIAAVAAIIMRPPQSFDATGVGTEFASVDFVCFAWVCGAKPCGEGGLLVRSDQLGFGIGCIVGEFEADVKKGKISVSSPIARAIIGKKKGDSVEVNTPGGGKSYEIAKVAWR